ncbi:hypothetical protein VZT92_002462 [Zoarces viviparus]|uniref:Uncharacterized protein n=1 Tax=Zoarces viviparus TaxID=48416 RepID=A0AAW1FYS3_ZOAVI
MNLLVTYEHAKSSLSNMVTDSFEAALDITDIRALNQLMDLIVIDVMNGVQSTFLLPAFDETLIMPHHNAMLPLTPDMIKVFGSEMKTLLKGKKTFWRDVKYQNWFPEIESDHAVSYSRQSERDHPVAKEKKIAWCNLSTPEIESDDSVPREEEQTIKETSSSESDSHKDAKTQETKRKMAVNILVEILVTRILRKSKVNSNFVNVTDIITHQVERTWAALEKVDFDISQQTFKNFDKIIFKDLCKKWGYAEMVLLTMSTGEPALGNFIASAIKDHLATPPKKKSGISRFFSSVGQAITGTGKRRDKVTGHC